MRYIYCYYPRHKDPKPRLHYDTCPDVARRNENARDTEWSAFFSDRQSADQDMWTKGLEPIPCKKCIDRPSRRRL